MTFATALAAARPGEIALRDGRESLSWAQADARLCRAVNAIAGLPLGPRRRVAIFAGNSARTVLAYAACTLAGVSAVAVNSHLTAAEVAYLLTDSATDAVLCDATSAGTARAAADLAGVASVVAWGDPLPDRVLAWSQWAGDPAEPATDFRPRPTLVYTSGTTGRPKAVELPPTSFVGGDDVVEHVRRLGANRMTAHGRHLVVGPLYHSGPLTGTRLFLAGVPITVLGRFDAETTLQAIERDGIGSTIMVPTHFQRLLALPEGVRRRYRHDSLRYVLQVGAACPQPVKRAMIDWWGPVLWESYGASEVGTTCMISAAEWLERPGSVGRAGAPFEAFVLGPDGRPARPGVEGPLWFRDTTGRGIVYASGSGDSPGTFTLGEIGRMDAEGYVWITDRFADLVVSGGVNIYPAEGEAALLEHPQVADVACIGVPDDEFGERLLALVVPERPDAAPLAEDLDAHCRGRLAGYKCPKDYVFVPTLERTAIGKLDKRALRQKYGSVAHA